MSDRTLSDLAEKMREIDICMLSTHGEDGEIAGRPMSNNADVDYDGDSYFFTTEETRMVSDIDRDPTVGLAFTGKDFFCVAVEGKATLLRDKATFEAHWTPDLDRWFEDGADTPGLVMIKVSAERVHYWDGEDNGEVKVGG